MGNKVNLQSSYTNQIASSTSNSIGRGKLIDVPPQKVNKLEKYTINEDEEFDDDSPMLQRSTKNADKLRDHEVRSLLPEYSLKEVKHHNKENDIWIIIDNYVYDVTSFWKKHPVSSNLIYKFAGKDASYAFNAASHSSYATELADKLKIGILAKNDRKGIDQRKMSVLDWVGIKSIQAIKPITIKSITIYPVKGCKGIQINEANIEQSGILNDRIYCIVDTETNIVVNQLKYQTLCKIQPVLDNSLVEISEDHKEIELFYMDDNNKKNMIIIPTKKDENQMIAIKFKNSSTPISSYDQGDLASAWITNFLHFYHLEDTQNKTFRFCKILRNNQRSHEEYFSLPFIKKNNQPIKGVLNYSAVNIIALESLDELNRRWSINKNKKNISEFTHDTFRVNIVLQDLPKPHFEDFIKFIRINNTELLWNRRRYFCTVPNVNQSTGTQTAEPQNLLTKYRNAMTLNDRTSLPGDKAVFFGSFYLVKQGGKIKVNDDVQVKQTQFNVLRTTRKKSYFGIRDDDLDDNFKLRSLMEYNKYILVSKKKLNHNCFHFRFKLNDNRILQHDESLKLQIGGHYILKINDNDSDDDEKEKEAVIRAYTPVNIYYDDDDEKYDENHEKIDYFDLVVKIYDSGKMAQYLKNMCVADEIECMQKYNTIKYIEIGTFRFGDPSYAMFAHYKLNVSYINMICGGTGISPMFQILNFVHLNKDIDKTKICVLYSNRTKDDILLLNQLNEIARNNTNIKIHHVITKEINKSQNRIDVVDVEPIHVGGRINKEMIKQYAYKSHKDTIALLCGPPNFEVSMQKCLQQLGFDDKHLHTF